MGGRLIMLALTLAGCATREEVLSCAEGSELQGTSCHPIDQLPDCPTPHAGSRVVRWETSLPDGLSAVLDAPLNDEYSPASNTHIFLVQQIFDGTSRVGLELARGRLLADCSVLGAEPGSLESVALDAQGVSSTFDLAVGALEDPDPLVIRDVHFDQLVTDDNGQLVSLRLSGTLHRTDADLVEMGGNSVSDLIDGLPGTTGDQWPYVATWTFNSALVDF